MLNISTILKCCLYFYRTGSSSFAWYMIAHGDFTFTESCSYVLWAARQAEKTIFTRLAILKSFVTMREAQCDVDLGKKRLAVWHVAPENHSENFTNFARHALKNADLPLSKETVSYMLIITLSVSMTGFSITFARQMTFAEWDEKHFLFDVTNQGCATRPHYQSDCILFVAMLTGSSESSLAD